MSDHEIHEEGLTRREALKRGAILGGVALAWTTPAVQIVGMSPALAQTTSPGVSGCTPGYWKNSPGTWPVPDTQLKSVFTFGSCGDGDDLLSDALGYKGNDGMVAILLRAAAAAYLNEQAFGPAYGYPGVVNAVNLALAGCDDATMEALKNQLDSANNAGCPLSNDNAFNNRDD